MSQQVIEAMNALDCEGSGMAQADGIVEPEGDNVNRNNRVSQDIEEPVGATDEDDVPDLVPQDDEGSDAEDDGEEDSNDVNETWKLNNKQVVF
jgi:hypothetical protein